MGSPGLRCTHGVQQLHAARLPADLDRLARTGLHADFGATTLPDRHRPAGALSRVHFVATVKRGRCLGPRSSHPALALLLPPHRPRRADRGGMFRRPGRDQVLALGTVRKHRAQSGRSRWRGGRESSHSCGRRRAGDGECPCLGLRPGPGRALEARPPNQRTDGPHPAPGRPARSRPTADRPAVGRVPSGSGARDHRVRPSAPSRRPGSAPSPSSCSSSSGSRRIHGSPSTAHPGLGVGDLSRLGTLP